MHTINNDKYRRRNSKGDHIQEKNQEWSILSGKCNSYITISMTMYILINTLTVSILFYLTVQLHLEYNSQKLFIEQENFMILQQICKLKNPLNIYLCAAYYMLLYYFNISHGQYSYVLQLLNLHRWLGLDVRKRSHGSHPPC